MEPLPKLFDPNHQYPQAAFHPSLTEKALLVAIVVVAVMGLAGVFPTGISHGGERISFSSYEAEPQVIQAREPIGFSIHARQESATKDDAPKISFSVYDAQPIDETATAKPDCSPARLMNRMLVIHPATQTIKVKVCDENGCRFELRTVPHGIVKQLKTLAPKWSCGDQECDHFRLVNADDPKQAELLRELDVKRDDLPMLVKETDVEKRKKASGMTADDIAKLWNKWFIEPAAEGEKAEAVEKCLPTFASSGEQWTYPGNIRHHLTDPRFPHHLPAALVATWSDAQCLGWHNWHHEVLSGRQRVVRQPEKSQQPAKPRQVSQATTERVTAIARSIVRSPPPQMVADAGSHPDRKAKKKPSMTFANGRATSGVG